MERRCAQCGAPLPAGSRAIRRFCSTRCRVQHWDRANPRAPDPLDDYFGHLFDRSLPKHYHGPLLVGHRDNVPWFGEKCPPECPGLRPGETYRPMEEFWRR
jgi:hypothetical protein